MSALGNLVLKCRIPMKRNYIVISPYALLPTPSLVRLPMLLQTRHFMDLVFYLTYAKINPGRAQAIKKNFR